MNPHVRRRIDQVRQRWWVVLLFAGVAILSAVLPLLNDKPTYVGKSTLVFSSGRGAVDEAAMAVGYATLFNDPATILRLRTEHNLRERTEDVKFIPDDVKFEARTVAASPILTIEATAKDAELAQAAAVIMADAFSDDMNAVRQRGYEKAIENTQRQLDLALSQPGPNGQLNPMAPIMQDQLVKLEADSANRLQELQQDAGVTKIEPNIVFELGLRAVGGLVLGILAALGLAALSTRIRNSADLRDKTGVEPLVEVPAGGSIERRRLREDRLRTLANIVGLQDLPKSPVVALTDSRGAQGARDLAEALAGLSAQQGYRTVLVYADNGASRQSHDAGFNDALAAGGLVNGALKDGAVDSLKIMPSGSVVADRYSLMGRDRIAAVYDELRTHADVIVVVAPSTADTTDYQSICATADLTILVVDRRSSRAGDVTSAADALADAHAVLLGAVLIDGTE